MYFFLIDNEFLMNVLCIWKTYSHFEKLLIKLEIRIVFFGEIYRNIDVGKSSQFF